MASISSTRKIPRRMSIHKRDSTTKNMVPNDGEVSFPSEMPIEMKAFQDVVIEHLRSELSELLSNPPSQSHKQLPKLRTSLKEVSKEEKNQTRLELTPTTGHSVYMSSDTEDSKGVVSLDSGSSDFDSDLESSLSDHEVREDIPKRNQRADKINGSGQSGYSAPHHTKYQPQGQYCNRVLGTSFPSLLSGGAYSDVRLKLTDGVSDRIIKGHKCILSEKSPFLRRLISAKDTESLPTIVLDSQEYEYVWTVIEFIYTGTIQHSGCPRIVWKLYRTAQQLEVRELETYFFRYILDAVERNNPTEKHIGLEYFQYVLESIVACADATSLGVDEYLPLLLAITKRSDFLDMLFTKPIRQVLETNNKLSYRLLCLSAGRGVV